MACCGMLVNLAKDPPRHLNSIWTLLSLTPRLSSTPPILTINIIKDMTAMIKDIMVVIRDMMMGIKDMIRMIKDMMMRIKAMMVMIKDLPMGAGHYLDLWSHQLTRDVTPPAIDTNPQYSDTPLNTVQYNTSKGTP